MAIMLTMMKFIILMITMRVDDDDNDAVSDITRETL